MKEKSIYDLKYQDYVWKVVEKLQRRDDFMEIFSREEFPRIYLGCTCGMEKKCYIDVITLDHNCPNGKAQAKLSGVVVEFIATLYFLNIRRRIHRYLKNLFGVK